MLQFDSVSVRFGEHHVQAVDDVTFTVSDGERCVVVGETGSGKSVLLLSILGLLPETAKISGKIILENQELLTMDEHELQRLRGRIIGYVPQGGGNSLNPLMRIGEQVSEPLVVHNEIKKPIAWQRAIQLLEQLHMERPERALCRYPHQFSGGMRQRALIAMGIIADTKLLLADEPTKGLDRANIDRTARTFLELEGKTLLCVTHDLRFARQIADTITVMYAGQIVESSPMADFFQAPLHPYGRALVEAMPENGMTIRMGFAPMNTEVSTMGCRFARRCESSTSRCIAKAPPLIKTADGRKVRCWLYESYMD